MSNNEIFNKTERALKGYNYLLCNIDLISKEIEIFKANENFKEKEGELINLNKAIRLKNILDVCINSLREVDRIVIELRYLNKGKLTWKQIANVVKFSEEHCRKRIMLRAINKIISTINESGIDINKLLKG